jgi:Rps23 Pro-64 3,4-dihydroxylase Tpa1-like proline 4-hydroxylase
MSFHLSSSLDRPSILADFLRLGHAHIADVMPSENAHRIRKGLLEKTPWNLAFNNGAKHVDLTAAQVHSMPRDKVNELQQAIYASARDKFQYCYSNYPIYDAYESDRNQGHILHSFYEWLNCEEFLQFARVVTGFDDISFVDAQATRYLPGHFLTTHDDSGGLNRRAAYIFNFTSGWRIDWGGYLQLLDDSGNVHRGFIPAFNALNILAVPQRHNVSLVAPFAGGMRLSISGWFRYGDKPKRSG